MAGTTSVGCVSTAVKMHENNILVCTGVAAPTLQANNGISE